MFEYEKCPNIRKILMDLLSKIYNINLADFELANKFSREFHINCHIADSIRRGGAITLYL